jgi:hypothetical protein
MDNDRNPAFVYEFYLCLRTLCQDLFMARTRQEAAGPATPPAVTHPLQSQFAQASLAERIGLVSAAVDLSVPLAAPSLTQAKFASVLSAAELHAADAGTTRGALATPSSATSHAEATRDADLLELIATARHEQSLASGHAARPALAEKRKHLQAQLEAD